MPELRHSEGWRRRGQGALPVVHASVCGHTGGHSHEQQVHESMQHPNVSEFDLMNRLDSVSDSPYDATLSLHKHNTARYE